jgi:2-phosphosulfolactate phosphatase
VQIGIDTFGGQYPPHLVDRGRGGRFKPEREGERHGVRLHRNPERLTIRTKDAARNISIGSLLQGATQATDAVAVIDVFRAFTTAAVVLANSASSIVMVGTVAETLALRRGGTGQVCMGEVEGHAPEGFDFGNSPFEVAKIDFRGKTVIQRTSAGTQGIIAASAAERLYAASLVTATATARALAMHEDRIALIAMGKNGIERTDEDELCALHLRSLLQGRTGDPEAVRRLILAGGEVARFNDPSRPHLRREDVNIALDINRYGFAVRVTVEDGLAVARLERSE